MKKELIENPVKNSRFARRPLSIGTTDPAAYYRIASGYVCLLREVLAKRTRPRRLLAHSISSLLLIVCALVTLATTTISSAQTFNLNGSIMSTDSFQNGRLNLNGSPSVAPASKAFPGVLQPTSTVYFFDDYTFTNTSAAAQPVTISLTGLSINPLSSVAYLTPFTPTNIAANYLGDAGISVVQNDPAASYSITVPAFTTFDVVVNEVNSMGGIAEYGLTVAGNGGLVTGTAVPELSSIRMMFFGAACLLAVMRFRSRRHSQHHL